MRILLWLATGAGALLGGWLWWLAVFESQAAPAQAATAALGVGAAVIPYVVARAWDELTRPEVQTVQVKGAGAGASDLEAESRPPPAPRERPTDRPGPDAFVAAPPAPSDRGPTIVAGAFLAALAVVGVMALLPDATPPRAQSTPTARSLEPGFYVASPVVNVRRGPTTDAPVVGQAVEGQRVRVEARDGTWWLVEVDGGERGWVHSGLLEEKP